MAIKISGSTIIDDDRNIVNAGIISATSFVGNGSGLIGVANTDFVVSAATTTNILNVGAAITANTSGLNVTGIITASTFVGNLSGAELINYAENLYAFGNTGATPTFQLSNGNFVTATLDNNITSMTFDLTGCPTTSSSFAFTLVLTNDGTASRTITWPASVKWPNNSVPLRTETANKSDVYTFFSYDAGTTWWGNLSLYNFS